MSDIIKDILLNKNLWGAIIAPVVAWLVVQIPDLAQNQEVLVASGIIAALFVVKQALDNFGQAQIEKAKLEAIASVDPEAIHTQIVKER